MTTVSSINIFARDLDRLIDFYAGLFGLSENLDQRGPIYRALDGGGVAIGFNAVEAYRLLNLDGFPAPAGVKSLLTFEVADHAAVERLTAQAEASGATIVKPPYDTFYGSRQSVVLDPEGNVFRINAFQPSAAS
jgi:predicted enzyme related to lactoylglutathione lyase